MSKPCTKGRCQSYTQSIRAGPHTKPCAPTRDRLQNTCMCTQKETKQTHTCNNTGCSTRHGNLGAATGVTPHSTRSTSFSTSDKRLPHRPTITSASTSPIPAKHQLRSQTEGATHSHAQSCSTSNKYRQQHNTSNTGPMGTWVTRVATHHLKHMLQNAT